MPKIHPTTRRSRAPDIRSATRTDDVSTEKTRNIVTKRQSRKMTKNKGKGVGKGSTEKKRQLTPSDEPTESATETGRPSKRREVEAPADIGDIEISGNASSSAAETSSASSSTPVIPELLQQKNIRDWSTNDVFTFLDANKNSQFGDKHINVIQDQEVAGIGLLELTKTDLIDKPYHLKGGPAAGIIKLVWDLKVAKGLAPQAAQAPQVPPIPDFLPATRLPFIPYVTPIPESSFRNREREENVESSTRKGKAEGKRKKAATDLAADDKEWSMFPIGVDTMVPEGNPTFMKLHDGRVRLLQRSEMKKIESVLEQGGRCSTRSVLRGGAGVGKSCVMLNAVYTARMRGWVVLYIPQAKLLMAMESINSQLKKFFRDQILMSKGALNNIANEDKEANRALYILHTIDIGDSWKLDDLIGHFKSYINAIRGIERIPILIAIDQWNAFIEKSTNLQCKNPIAELFGSFSQFMISRGVYLVAVSSSLVKMQFSDGDARFATSVRALTDEQMRVLVTDLVRGYKLEIDLTSEFFEFVKKATGCVTRLVCWIFQLWEDIPSTKTITATSPTHLVPENVMVEFIGLSTEYYKMRVTSLLERSYNRLRDYKFALWLLSGNRVSNASSDGFREAGIVNAKGEVPCEQARNAILYVLSDKRTEAIRILASVDPCKWFAHELAFWSAFSPSGGFILAPVKNAKGVDCRNLIELHFSRIRHQDNIPSGTADMTTNHLEFGDFIILAPCHPALDFVGYTVKGILVLGQISISPYTGTDRHSVDALFQKRKLGTRDNVVDFYLQCAGLNILTRQNREKKEFPSNVLFLYVTTSTVYLSTSQHCNDAVFVIDRNVLVRYFGYPEELVN